MKSVKSIIYAALMLFLFFSLVRNIFNYKSRYQFFENYKSDYEKEKKRNVELKTEIVKKKSNDEMEKIIRNKLNLTRPNEVAVIVPSPTPIPVVVTPTAAPPWAQWWSLLGL